MGNVVTLGSLGGLGCWRSVGHSRTSIIVLVVCDLPVLVCDVGKRDSSEMDARSPFVAVLCFETWLLVHFVDLLYRQTLCLIDEEVDKEDADEAGGAPDEEDLGLKVSISGTIVDEVWSRVSNGPVERPLLVDRKVSNVSLPTMTQNDKHWEN